MKRSLFSLRANLHTLVIYCFERDTWQRALKTALVVGTILVLINHGQALLTGHMTPDRLVSLLVTYLVLFSVSML